MTFVLYEKNSCLYRKLFVLYSLEYEYDDDDEDE
jgi:hypothetical protein